MYHPELDDDEVPENVIKVFDHEIKCEKVLTGEELAKLEEKRIKEEERLRLQGNDNFRERALLHMMDGRLEVRKIKKESEESLKPEWMSKPKGDMTEDEKRQFEEYEQKLAVAKEEQEIERVLLKNELQKLQTAISKLLEDFDSKIFQFSQTKLQYDTAIYVRELSMIKLNQFALTAQYNELIVSST